MKEIGVIILTYNAPLYVKKTITSLNEVTDKETRKRLEIIVWDNASESETKELLNKFHKKGYIDKLHFSEKNLLFAGGNNCCTKLASPNLKYYLLLNSDVLIKDKYWIEYLLKAKEKYNSAAVSFGYCRNPDRCDGYCFLIDKECYDSNQLDEQYQWWWGITKLQATLLNEGKSIVALKHHNHIIYHYGGKSGDAFKMASGMNTEIREVLSWFTNSSGRFISKSSLNKGNFLKYFNN